MQPIFKQSHPPKFHPEQSFLLSVSLSNEAIILDLDQDAQSTSDLRFPLTRWVSLLDQRTSPNDRVSQKKEVKPVQAKLWFDWINKPADFFESITDENSEISLFEFEDFEIETESHSVPEGLAFVLIVPSFKEMLVCLTGSDSIKCRRICLKESVLLDYKEFGKLYFLKNETREVGCLDLRNFTFENKLWISQIADMICKKNEYLSSSNEVFDSDCIQIFEEKGILIQKKQKEISIWSIDNTSILKTIKMYAKIECFDYYFTSIADPIIGRLDLG